MSETSAKVRINQKDGIIEIEGSEEFVEKILNDYRDLFSIKTTTSPDTIPKKTDAKKSSVKKVAGSKPRKKGVSESVVAINIDLGGTDTYSSLKEFYAEKKPQSFQEKTCVFIYFVAENLGITPVTPGHLLTCYRVVNSRIPARLGQTILDSKKRGWVTPESGINGGSLSHVGINLVKYDLPRKKDD